MMIKTRQRLTEQSIVNIKAAVSAYLIPVNDYFELDLVGSTGKRIRLFCKKEPFRFKNKTKANKILSTYNPNLVCEHVPEI